MWHVCDVPKFAMGVHHDPQSRKMETSLHYDLAQKQLGFKLREGPLTCKPGLELKANGLFNSVTGKLSYVGTAKAVYKVGKDVKDAGSTPLKLGEFGLDASRRVWG